MLCYSSVIFLPFYMIYIPDVYKPLILLSLDKIHTNLFFSLYNNNSLPFPGPAKWFCWRPLGRKYKSSLCLMVLVTIFTGNPRNEIYLYPKMRMTQKMGQGGVTALSCWTMTMRLINPQLTLNMCRTCCSSCIPTNLGDPTRSIWESSRC